MKRPAIVVYDIFDDKRRAQLREALGPVADRFQQSGWMIPDTVGANPRDIVTLLAELLASEDRLRVHAPCPTCTRAAVWLPDTQIHRLTTAPVWIAK